jgi:hypothetical protein
MFNPQGVLPMDDVKRKQLFDRARALLATINNQLDKPHRDKLTSTITTLGSLLLECEIACNPTDEDERDSSPLPTGNSSLKKLGKKVD